MKFAAYFLFLSFFLAACDATDNRNGFTTPSGVANEGDGVKTITIDLGRKVTTGTTIYYMVGGSAFLNGDYEVLGPASLNSSTFVVQAKGGESTTTLSIELIDDIYVEPETESIYFFIAGSSDSDLNGSLKNVQYVLEVEDNDTAPTAGLQVDLSWNTGDGISINTANFDLYLARNVQLGSNDQLTDFDLVDSVKSTNPSGFESFILPQDITDEVYYVIISFVEGSTSAELFLHLSQGSEYENASGRVNPNYVGKNLYYGPISKSGNTFSFH
jgi:hypothetical protein